MMDETEAAKRILERADKVLASVNESFIVTSRNHEQRNVPTFRPEEISLGAVLGRGGFGVVNEIEKFTLDDEMADQGSPQHFKQGSQIICVEQEEDLSMGNHIHYDIRKARYIMVKKCRRKGTARYALKRLHSDLTELERARGMVDLAVEARYLSIVWHPNIIKLRGIAKGDMMKDGFFIILDRLHGTLDKKMDSWRNIHKKHSSFFCITQRSRRVLRDLMLERLTVAYDLAAAFFYLHENRLVYRDIKPANIGFDLRGDVKVFDFGLVKSLSSSLRAHNNGYGYRLTGRAGSLPYMAPEVVKMETYDSKCDVFSFAILMWEILSLKECCKGFTPAQFVERVVVNGERFPIRKNWPPLTRCFIPEAWDANPRKRPDMKRVAILIRGDLNDMTSDETVLLRTNHMINRSNHSLNGFDGGPESS